MTATMDAVEAAVGGSGRLYPLGGVPGSPTYPYGVYSATLGQGDVYMNDGGHGVRHGRVVMQTFGHTADAALTLMETVATVLMGRVLDIDGHDPTPTRLEFDPVVLRDPDDDGVVGVTATFTFNTSEE